MNEKWVYVGPTIRGLAARNTVYDDLPESLEAAIQGRPYLASLCIPVSSLSTALQQIERQQGSLYTLYQKALSESADLEKGGK